jgi:hypothetical protein
MFQSATVEPAQLVCLVTAGRRLATVATFLVPGRAAAYVANSSRSWRSLEATPCPFETPTPAAVHLFRFSAHRRSSSVHRRNSLSPFHLLPIPLTHRRVIFLRAICALL